MLELPTAFALASIAICGYVLLAKMWRHIKLHFTASEQLAYRIDADGNKREYATFHSTVANTLIGRTIGRACIAWASWRFNRRNRDAQSQAQQ